MPNFEGNYHEFFSKFTFLDVKILVITVSFPNPSLMTKEWFIESVGIKFIESCSIVLVSDPRSFYFTEFLFQTPAFTGIVLCTHAVYRLGRLFIKEIKSIRESSIEISINLSIVPMIFLQPYSYGEICITPYSNGTGLGNCNWLITKGNDPELVSFRAFVVTGMCINPLVYAKPTLPDSLDVVCFLPSSKSNIDCYEYLEQTSRIIDGKLKERMKIVIPAFSDDSLYIIMHYLRIKKAFSNDFYVYSFFFEKLKETLNTIAPSFLKDLDQKEPEQKTADLELTDINQVFEIQNPNKEIPRMSINFAPYPTMEFGQIIKILEYFNDTFTFIHHIFKQGEGGFTMNSSWPKPLHFFDKIKSSEKEMRFYVPLEKQQTSSNTDNQSQQQKIFSSSISDQPQQQKDVEYKNQFSYPINDDLYRWMDVNELKDYEQKIGLLTCIGGEIKGEKVELQDIHLQTILNTSTIDSFGMKLIELGASNLQRHDNSINCCFPFIEGDNQVTIDFEGEDITITTGSAVIENAIFSMIHTDESTI